MTERPLRVLHAYRTYFPDTQGGAEELIRQICQNVAPHGVESRIYALSPRPAPHPLQRPEGRLYQVKRTFEVASCGVGLGGLRAFRRLARWADVLHLHFPWPWGDVLALAAGEDRPLVVTYHSDIVRQRLLGKLYAPLGRRLLARAARVVATSPQYAARSAVLRALGERVVVIPAGLDPAHLPRPDPAQVATLRERYGDPFFFFVGVFRYYKGLTWLVRAAAELPASVVIAGAGPDEAALRAEAARLGLDNVHFPGAIDDADKMAHLAACRAFVLPSHLPAESFGMALLEAAHCGKPLVTCEIGTGTSFVNVHGETGLVVPPADPTALAAALRRLADDPELARRLGENARRRFAELFSGAALGRHYAELYREVAGR